jgi:uncharacterized membrane protein
MTRGVDIAMAIVLLVLGVMLITAVIHRRDSLARERLIDLAFGVSAVMIGAIILWR